MGLAVHKEISIDNEESFCLFCTDIEEKQRFLPSENNPLELIASMGLIYSQLCSSQICIHHKNHLFHVSPKSSKDSLHSIVKSNFLQVKAFSSVPMNST